MVNYTFIFLLILVLTYMSVSVIGPTLSTFSGACLPLCYSFTYQRKICVMPRHYGISDIGSHEQALSHHSCMKPGQVTALWCFREAVLIYLKAQKSTF